MNVPGIKTPVKRLGGNLGYTGWSKSDFGPATCEDFTKSKLGWSGDICLSMVEKSIYAFGDGRLTP